MMICFKPLIALVEVLDKRPVGAALTLAMLSVGACAAALLAIIAR